MAERFDDDYSLSTVKLLSIILVFMFMLIDVMYLTIAEMRYEFTQLNYSAHTILAKHELMEMKYFRSLDDLKKDINSLDNRMKRCKNTELEHLSSFALNVVRLLGQANKKREDDMTTLLHRVNEMYTRLESITLQLQCSSTHDGNIPYRLQKAAVIRTETKFNKQCLKFMIREDDTHHVKKVNKILIDNNLIKKSQDTNM